MVPRRIRIKMILLLIVMTPGIPEYMTGSSKFAELFFDTHSFFVGLVLNIALYSTGALLIREFSIKYNRGWASILALGLAYGIMEEGISVHTFFIPSGNPVGLLANYGRFLGVDWLWALGISFFHAIFSIGLPIFLLSIAYPKYSREPLLGWKGSTLTLFVYALDVLFLNFLVNSQRVNAMPTTAEYIFFILLSFVLVLLARLLPEGLLKGRGTRNQGTRKLFLLGLTVYPLYLVNAFTPALVRVNIWIPPPVEFLLYIVENFLVMFAISHHMPVDQNRKHKFALAMGLIAPLFVWGGLIQIIGVTNLISIVLVIAIVFLFRLRNWVRTGQNAAVVVFGTTQ